MDGEDAALANVGADDTENEVTEFVTLADEDEGDESDVEAGEEGDDEGEGKAGDEPEGGKRRQSGSQKWRERARNLERELAELRGGQRRQEPASTGDDGDDDLKEPQEKDFKNWLEYDRAVKKYDARMAVREEAKRGQDRAKTATAQREAQQRAETFQQNVKSARDRIPDFDRVMAETANAYLHDSLVPLIQESSKGPLLAYYLAKNSDVRSKLNAMSPAQAARELGRIEARIRTPKGKTATSARRPNPPPRGGGSRATPDPSKMSMAEYAKWRAGGGG